MPNSGTVTAGSVALASQYNNLRSDVLDTSTGHVHSGSADAGAQIEATYLKSTGATAGQVLTATAGTGASWTTLSQSGAIAVGTATFSFPSAFTGGASGSAWFNAAAATARWGQYGNGTVLFAISYAQATSRAARIFNSGTVLGGSVAASATATINPVVAGTTTQNGIVTYAIGFEAGTSTASTAVYFGEEVAATTTAAKTVSLRKYNLSLSANTWNAIIVNGVAGFSAVGTGMTQTGAKYSSTMNAWYTVQGHASTATYSNVYVINDSNGAISSAAFPTNVNPQGYIYVPPSGAGNGTIHAWGTGASGAWHRVSYEASATAITALATATSDILPMPGAGTVNVWGDAWWDSQAEAIVIRHANYSGGAGAGLVGVDRSFGTVLWQSINEGYNTLNEMAPAYAILNTTAKNPTDAITSIPFQDGYFVVGRTSSQQTGLYKVGKKGSYYLPSFPLAVSVDNGLGYGVPNFTVGNGSAEYWCNAVAVAGQTLVMSKIPSFADGTVLAAGTVGRLVTMDTTYWSKWTSQAQVLADNAIPFTNLRGVHQDGTSVVNTFAMAQFPLYLPANSSLSIRMVQPSIAFDDYQINAATYAAGTAKFSVTAINLA